MKNTALHPKRWPEFCEAFTQLNRGTMMTVQLVHLDGHREEVIREGVFRKMTFDTGDACNNMLTLAFEREGERRVNHVVVEPIHLRVKERNGRQKFLQIEAENGVTLVSFHSGKVPQLPLESEFEDVDFRKEQPSNHNPIPS